MEKYGKYGKIWKQYAIIRNHMEYYAIICKIMVNTQYGIIWKTSGNICKTMEKYGLI